MEPGASCARLRAGFSTSQGVAPDDSGHGTRGRGARVEVTIDAIREIANSTLPAAEEDATHSSSSFKNLTLDVTAPSEATRWQGARPPAPGAHEVFVETINGMISDLQDFAEKLLDVDEQPREHDDAAQRCC